MSETFKVGDVVRIHYDRGNLSEAVKIDKQHANGNLLVAGKQFSVNGYRRGGHAYAIDRLILDGSDECKKIIETKQKINYLWTVQNMHVDADLVDMDELVKIYKTFKSWKAKS